MILVLYRNSGSLSSGQTIQKFWDGQNLLKLPAILIVFSVKK
jgi:hypothetical protein